MFQISDEGLFERFRRLRDAGSLAKVFDRTAPALMRLALHLSHERHVAEDLVQQTFLTAIEKADRWDRERGLFPWLVGILTNRARLHQRAQRREPDTERLTRRSDEQPSDAAATRELEVAVEEAIEELGDTYRPVLHLHLFHGLNAKEIAAAIGRPAGSVRTQLVRGLERLRRALPIGLGVATTAAGATAAVRHRVLATFAPDLTAGAVGSASLLLGGTLMKKWLLLVPIAVIGVLVYWQTTGMPDGLVPAPAPGGAELATAQMPDAPDSAAAAANETTSIERSAVDLVQTTDPDTGSLVVRVGFADEELSAIGIWVRMLPEPRTRDGQRFGARVDAKGQVRFDGIPPGNWLVQAENSSLDAKVTLQIEAGREYERQLTIERAIPIQVRVVDEARRPVGDADVWVCMQYFGRVWPMEVTTRLAARTDANGRATVAAGLESRIGARKLGYAASTAGKADAVKDEELLLMLMPGPGAIRGVVVDDDGTPIPGAAVFVSAGSFNERGTPRAADGRAAEPPASVFTEAGADGSFAIEGLAAGSYHVFGIAPGVLDAELEVVVRAFEPTQVRIVMRRSVPINVRTTRADGTPIPGLLVYGRDPQGKLIGGGSITDRNGIFTFAAPRAGYHIEVKREQVLLAERRNDAPLLSPVEVDIVIDEHLVVRGRLVDEQDKPVAGWRVVAVSETASESDLMRALAFAFDADSKADGSFEIWGELRQPLQVAACYSGMGAGARDLVLERGVPVGTDGLKLVVPIGKLPRSVLRGRVVDANGHLLTDATARSLGSRDGPNGCKDGVLRIEGLRHGKQSFHVAAPGFGNRRLELDIQNLETDLADIVLQRAVELRVRPVFPSDTQWLGPLPRASIQTVSGRSLWPQPTPTIDNGELVFTEFPPGEYVLHPHSDEQIAAEPVLFELVGGVPKTLDWPVRVGRKRLLLFTPTANQPAPPDSMLKITIVDENDQAAVDKEVKSWNGKWVFRHAFVPGSYRATGKSAAGHSFEGKFEVRLDQGTGENESQVEVPVKR